MTTPYVNTRYATRAEYLADNWELNPPSLAVLKEFLDNLSPDGKQMLKEMMNQPNEEYIKEQEMLDDNKKRRADAIIKYEPFLDALYSRKGRGRNTRWAFRRYIYSGGNRTFNTAEEEYEFIGKFGRGYWSEEFCKDAKFTKEERDTIVELGQDYGAFDY